MTAIAPRTTGESLRWGLAFTPESVMDDVPKSKKMTDLLIQGVELGVQVLPNVAAYRFAK